MANRLNAPNQFESLSPPWLLTQLDTNFVQNQAAWNDSSLGFVNGVPTDTGTANNYTITAANLPFGSPTGYNKGMTLFWIPANTNTGASSITVLPLGSTGIVNAAGLALSGGEIIANKRVGMVHDGTNFRIITPIGLSFQATNPGAVTLNCAGYDSVSVLITYTSSTTTPLTLQNVGYGVSVSASWSNSFASAVNYSIQATDPGGSTANCSITWTPKTVITGGSRISLQSGATVSAQSLGSGLAVSFTGVTRYVSSLWELDF